jgi:uncharacterized 2Fe-2S/4Fe-4S cluster protein (DUF4445 family)
MRWRQDWTSAGFDPTVASDSPGGCHCEPVSLLPSDVRELQLAKGAIAAGLRLLAATFGASVAELHRLHLAGAFGNYISRASARRIGLLGLPLERVVPAGNTALLGAKLYLFAEPAAWDAVASRIEHVSLNEHPDFHDIYAEEMRFPGGRSGPVTKQPSR